MATILHLSCDFPDPLVPHKTAAIQRLVDATPQHRNIVYSLNRVPGVSGADMLEFAEDRFAVAYRAPSKGLLLKTRMEAVAQYLLSDIRRRRLSIDMVQAHKLTIEGIAAMRIATELGVPLAFTIQGDSDLKVMSVRRDLQSAFAAHIRRASVLFPLAPWTEAAIEERFPGARSKMAILPVISALEEMAESPHCGRPRLVSVFHLNSWSRKNLDGMAAALARLRQSMPGISLDVIGGGSAASLLAAKEAIRRHHAEDLVHLRGPMPNAELPAMLKRYAAFILPTRRESYGLAHVEALFNGLPVLLSRNMGIDGLVPEASYAVACDPQSVPGIADGIIALLRNEAEAKRALASAQKQGELAHLQRPAILETYHRGLHSALQGSENTAALVA